MGRTRKMITVETERVTVISRRKQPAVGWCEKCGEVVELLSDAEVLARAQAAGEEKQLHAAQTPDGMLLICPQSLGEEPGYGTRDQQSGKQEAKSQGSTKE